MLRFREKGNKSREIPVSHDLKVWLDAYIDAADLDNIPPWEEPENGNLRRPLFPTWRPLRNFGSFRYRFRAARLIPHLSATFCQERLGIIQGPI